MKKLTLSKFYEALKTKLSLEKKYKHDSCFISLVLDTKSNVRFRIVRDSSISKKEISKSDLTHLLSANLIRESHKEGNYELTGHGIWEMEKDGLMNDSKLINYIDQKYLYVPIKPLDGKEKIVLMSIIAGRAFSKRSSLDLHYEFSVDSWIELLHKTYELLVKFDVKLPGLDNEESWKDVWIQKGNEKPISHLVRHTDFTAKRVNGYYVAGGKQTYFLDVSKDESLLTDRLSYILKKIFQGKLSYKNINDLVNFCNDQTKATALFKDNNIFARSDFDYDIDQAIQTTVLES